MMRLFYITLNNESEARAIAARLFEQRAAVCCNWFPVHCAYLEEDEVREGPEIVLLVKTRPEKKAEVEAAVAAVVNYVNFVGEIPVLGTNPGFADWLNRVVR